MSIVPPLRALEAIPIENEGRELVVLRDPSGISDAQIAISPDLVPILNLFDGRTDLENIVSDHIISDDKTIVLEQLEKIVRILDDSFFFQNKQFEDHLSSVLNEYQKSAVRKSCLVGRGIPEDVEQLSKLLDSYLQTPDPDDFEPEPIPENQSLKGIIAPHIDFIRGHATYGRLYRVVDQLLEEYRDAEPLFIILGVAHKGALAPIVFTAKDFETPYGLVKTNQNAVETIKNELGDEPFREEWIHKDEHSVEFQVIWLSHLMRDKPFTILPGLVGILEGSAESSPSDTGVEKYLETLKGLIESHKGPVITVSGVDFSHVGLDFGDQEKLENERLIQIAKRDHKALEAVKKMDSEQWWNTIMKDDNSTRICGTNTMYITLRLLEKAETTILDYDQAVAPDKSIVVSYAGAVFTD